MHTYTVGGGKENIRRSVMLMLFCLSVILCTLGNIVIDKLHNALPTVFGGIDAFFANWPWMGISVSSVSAFTVFGALFWLFDKHIWKLRIIQKWTGVTDFTGEWEGILKSSFDETKEFSMRLVVKQTWSKISICSHFSEADSWSDIAHIDSEHGKGAMLKFTYVNRAQNVSWPIREHRGENELFLGDFNKTKKKFTSLKGDYFNNRGRNGNVGYIELVLKDS